MRKSNFYNLLIVYLGLFLGFFNTIFRTKAITAEEIGLIAIIISLSGILQYFTLLGIPNIILKYYSKRKKESEKNGLLILFSAISFVAFIIISLTLYFNKQIIFKYYNNELLITYVNYIIYYLFINTFMIILEQISKVIYKSVITNFYRNFLLRIVHMCLLIIIIAFNLNFAIYIKTLLMINLFIIVLMFISIKRNINIRKVDFLFIFKDFNIYFKYGFFMLISGMTLKLINQIDKLMIAYLVSLKETGIYTIAIVISGTINLIGNAYMRLIQPKLSDAFANDDILEVEKIYKTNANQQIYLGIYLFTVIVIFSTYILEALGNDYKNGVFALIITAVGFLINVSTGMCGTIIELSKFYKTNFYLNILLLLLTVVTNYIFIPKYGITGAAFATSISISIHNIIKVIYVKMKFNILPFGYNNLKLLLSIVISIPIMLLMKKHLAFFNNNLVYVGILSAVGFILYDFILAFIFKMKNSITSAILEKL